MENLGRRRRKLLDRMNRIDGIGRELLDRMNRIDGIGRELLDRMNRIDGIRKKRMRDGRRQVDTLLNCSSHHLRCQASPGRVTTWKELEDIQVRVPLLSEPVTEKRHPYFRWLR